VTGALSPSSNAPLLQQRAWWLLIAIHVPFLVFIIAQGGFGLAFPPPAQYKWIGFPLALVVGAIQFRHSLAAAAGMRPRQWRWTLLLLFALTYLPMVWLGFRWATVQWFLSASLAMLLPPRTALLAISATAIAFGVWYASGNAPITDVAQLAWAFWYWVALQFLGAGGLYGATRLVRFIDELRDARAGLAELAIERERLRIARDLHDLLGQSLSAVSLKGDLAVGLLERGDVAKATSEIESLVAVARSALHDVLDVAHREPPIALSAEINRATDLLASTGTETRVDIRVDELPPPVDELFAWALREGVTNVLRHSAATACSISIRRQDDGVRLEILNDGAMPPALGGSGLAGLASRAAVLSGEASGRLLGDGRFRLRVEVPVPAEVTV
jgi:two-component system sensor histidine kinase DesK